MAEDNQIIAELILKGADGFKRELNSTLPESEKVKTSVAGIGTEAQESFTQATTATTSFKAQLRLMKEEVIKLTLDLSNMADAGKQGTKEFNELEKKITKLNEKAGQLDDAIKDANKTIGQAGSDTKGLDKAIRVVGSATAAFQVYQGAAALAGKNNEDLQKALVKLNAVMAITQGLQQIQNELTRNDSVLKGVATIATNLFTAAQRKFAQATLATKAALTAIGLGGIITLVYAAITAYEAFTGATKSLTQATDDLREAQEKKNEALLQELQYRVNIGKLTEQQAAQEKLNIATADKVESEKKLNDLLARRVEVQKQLSDSDGQTGLLSELIGLNEQIPAAQKLFNENVKSVGDAEKALDAFNKKTKESTAAIKSQGAEVEKLGGVLDSLRRRFREGFVGPVFFSPGQQARTEAEFDRAGKEAGEAYRAGFNRGVDGGTKGGSTGILGETFSKFQKAYGEIQNVITSTVSLISNASNIRAEKEQQILDDKRKRGLITEKQYEREVAKLKNESAKKQHRAAVINAFLMIPQAVTAAFLSALVPGDPTSIIRAGIFAGIAGAFATAQAAIIAASPIPKFFKGVIDLQSNRHPNGIDTVPAMLTKGESVITAEKTTKHKKALLAIHKGYFNDMFIERNLATNPVINMHGKQKEREDYKMLEHLANIGGYMKQDYKANAKGNDLLKQLIDVSKPKNRNA